MEPQEGLRLAIVGGGTGGHVVPGLHLLAELMVAGEDLPPLADLCWFETGRRAEVESMRRLDKDLAGVPLERVRLAVEPPGGGAPGKGRLLSRTPSAFLRARKALARHDSQLLFGLGGFTLLPAVLAARSLGIPVALLEINAQPGRAVRFLTPLAQRVYHAWRASLPAGPRSSGAAAQRGGGAAPLKHLLTGPPLPAGLAQAGDPERWLAEPGGDGPLLVVLGGSQGAKALNDFVRASLPRWSEAGLRVVHQVGPGRLDEAAAPLPGYLALEFVDDVPGLLRAATLVLCRAGASTLAEVAALGVPAVAVPYPGAGGHQRDNAAEFGESLRLVEEPELGESVSAELIELAGEPGQAWRASTSLALRERVPVDSSRRILLDLVELIEARRRR